VEGKTVSKPECNSILPIHIIAQADAARPAGSSTTWLTLFLDPPLSLSSHLPTDLIPYLILTIGQIRVKFLLMLHITAQEVPRERGGGPGPKGRRTCRKRKISPPPPQRWMAPNTLPRPVRSRPFNLC